MPLTAARKHRTSLMESTGQSRTIHSNVALLTSKLDHGGKYTYKALSILPKSGSTIMLLMALETKISKCMWVTLGTTDTTPNVLNPHFTTKAPTLLQTAILKASISQ